MAGKAMKRYWVFFFGVVWVAAVSCTADTLPTPVAIEPLTTAKVTATGIQTVTSTFVVPTLTPAVIPTEEPFASPTPKPTNTRSPTLTPLPTVPPEEASMYVEDLLGTNAGCRFPCWWGIIPGETPWTETRNFLDTFATDYAVSGFGGGKSGYEVFVPSPLTNRPIVYSFIVADGIVTGIVIGYGEVYWKHYKLHEILETYGEPTEVWIRTYSGVPEPPSPFRVILYYPHQGIMVHYENVGVRSDDQIVGCPQEVDEFPDLSSPPRLPSLWLFTPSEKATFVETVEHVESSIEAENYLPLEQATNMNIEMFYELFKEADNATCLTTPVELW